MSAAPVRSVHAARIHAALMASLRVRADAVRSAAPMNTGQDDSPRRSTPRRGLVRHVEAAVAPTSSRLRSRRGGPLSGAGEEPRSPRSHTMQRGGQGARSRDEPLTPWEVRQLDRIVLADRQRGQLRVET